MNSVAAMSLAMVLRGLQSSLDHEKTLRQSLEHEIDERKNAEQDLRDSEMQYRLLAENVSDVIWTIDKAQRFTYISPSIQKLRGYTPEEAMLIPLENTLTPVSYEKAVFVMVEELAIEGDPGVLPDRSQVLELEHIRKDGSTVWGELTTSFIRDEDGLPSGIIGITRDITDRKRAIKEKALLEAQLQQAQKMESVGRLAGGVAHDYNNALSVIIGFTEMAIDDVDPDGLQHDNLNEVLNAARRATDITRQLLAFARKQLITPRVLDLNENVESMLKMLRRLIGEDIDLSWLPGTSLWPVKLDSSQIDQMLANLCINARDAIDGVGKVTIETGNADFDEANCADHSGFVPGAFVQLAVSDNGCGMDKEILDNIFEPFFTTKDVDKGTGLGLATVYGIVKQNNGFINVYSEPDKGTTIKIYLPRHEGNAAVIQDKITTEIPTGHGETVLVVEDDLQILKLARQILEGLDYTVLTAGTPGKALELVKTHAGKIHLLVTDVIMPEMNGRELAQQMKSLYPELKRVFMSGYTANVIAHHGVLDKGVRFIQKPFSRRDLAITVRKALDDLSE
ncbi:MAG: PAS domain S-box protein [Desulfobacteraceae bacterium]|nr:PAS domain S-box protein [Desulfobacteraceae bacterium]